MPIEYVVDGDGSLVRTNASGVVTLEDLKGYFNRIMTDTTIVSPFVEYVSFAAVDDLQFSYSAGTQFGLAWRRYKQKGCAGTIVYAPGDLVFGLVRMVQTIVEGSEFGAEGDFSVFRELAEAEAALKELLALM